MPSTVTLVRCDFGTVLGIHSPASRPDAAEDPGLRSVFFQVPYDWKARSKRATKHSVCALPFFEQKPPSVIGPSTSLSTTIWALAFSFRGTREDPILKRKFARSVRGKQKRPSPVRSVTVSSERMPFSKVTAYQPERSQYPGGSLRIDAGAVRCGQWFSRSDPSRHDGIFLSSRGQGIDRDN